jgi:hypothetical protein
VTGFKNNERFARAGAKRTLMENLRFWIYVIENLRLYVFVPGLQTKHLGSAQNNKFDAFRLNLFAPFEIFWVYMSANLICKQTVTVLCEHT